MCSLESLTIDLREVTEGEKTIAFNLDDDYFKAIDSAEIKHGDVRAQVCITNVAGTYKLDIHCEGEVSVPCDICLDDMRQAISSDNTLTAKLGDEYSEDDDLITVDRENGQLDLAWFLYEFITLAVPIKHVHQEGECNPEMLALLNRHSAGQKADDGGTNEVDPRWSELEKLKTIIKD